MPAISRHGDDLAIGIAQLGADRLRNCIGHRSMREVTNWMSGELEGCPANVIGATLMGIPGLLSGNRLRRHLA